MAEASAGIHPANNTSKTKEYTAASHGIAAREECKVIGNFQWMNSEFSRLANASRNRYENSEKW
jgi:hypothetical protein